MLRGHRQVVQGRWGGERTNETCTRGRKLGNSKEDQKTFPQRSVRRKGEDVPTAGEVTIHKVVHGQISKLPIRPDWGKAEGTKGWEEHKNRHQKRDVLKTTMESPLLLKI